MNLSISKALRSILISKTALKNAVNSVIVPLVADNGTNYPFISYQKTNEYYDRNKDRFTDIETAEFNVNVYSNTYQNSIEVAQSVCDVLASYNGTIDNVTIHTIEVNSVSEEFSEDCYIQRISITIKYK